VFRERSKDDPADDDSSSHLTSPDNGLTNDHDLTQESQPTAVKDNQDAGDSAISASNRSIGVRSQNLTDYC
jgi:hypothetical protein